MARTLEARDDIRVLVAPAQGFFDLGLFTDAWAALDDLPIENAARPEVIALRLDVLVALNRLDDAVALGTGACRIWPRKGTFFLVTASALMGLADHAKAMALLIAGPSSLRAKAAFWYDLARCQARAGDVLSAKKSLAKCFERDKGFRTRALDEPDLNAVW